MSPPVADGISQELRYLLESRMVSAFPVEVRVGDDHRCRGPTLRWLCFTGIDREYQSPLINTTPLRRLKKRDAWCRWQVGRAEERVES